jgi:hypothetical protein
MFFKKRREQKKAAEKARGEMLSNIQHKLDEAKICPDAGEKYLLLKETETMIAAALLSEAQGMHKKAGDKGLNTYMAGAGGGMTILVGSAVLGAPLVGFAALVIVPASVVWASKVQHKELERLAKESAFVEPLIKFHVTVTGLQAEMLEKQIMPIAASKRFDEICGKYPEVSQHFARSAAAKKTIENIRRPKDGPAPPSL